MSLTAYHAQYFAHDLTRYGGQGLERLSQSLFNARVDLNPHQVEAAIFALRSPFSKGVMLCDEVGLGKTIEAGLVLCQLWAERRRRLLIVCPAALRKQWQTELEEKFHLPTRVVDQTVFERLLREGRSNPFYTDKVVIVSYHYAARRAQEIRSVPWDLVVFDEAHKLRNSHRESNVVGQRLRWAFEGRRKILLTATPLQNNLSELYGLASFLDDQLFGDFPTFRTLYCGADGDLDDLRQRLGGFCRRTLRKDVLEFIRYTERKLITIKFRPDDEEQKLYDAVSEFLQRTDTYAIPHRQRHLLSVVLRKVLASSAAALSGTLDVIYQRLVSLRTEAVEKVDWTQQILKNEELDEELLEQLLEEVAVAGEESTPQESETVDRVKLEKEIAEVEQFARWARSIGIDTKTRNLLKALEIGWARMAEMGAAQKAVIFTESRRTMAYLRDFLEANGYAGQVVCFSGSSKDPHASAIYEQWLSKNKERATGSRTADIRHAIVNHFRHHARILIATEAAAEGFNLQFCSLLVNFDLPWNPQRIEQRIGRVHRYGQQHDVVVINFLNERNAADLRVYELLRYKFQLFEGIFGVSDGILGQLENSAALEKRIHEIYQQCRTPEQIEEAFERLQAELDEQIKDRMKQTREKILENFDEDVQSLLKVDYDEALRTLDGVGRKFWRLTKYVLGSRADFNDKDLTFVLRQSVAPHLLPGTFALNRKQNRRSEGEAGDQYEFEIYHLSHPLGEWCLHQAKLGTLPVSEVMFDLSGYSAKISALEPLLGQSGWMLLQLLRIECLDAEEYLLFSGCTDNGVSLDHDLLEQFFRLDGVTGQEVSCPESILVKLEANAKLLADSTIRRSLEQSNKLFLERREQLYRWADDVVAAAERDLKLVKAELRAAEREAALADTIEKQIVAQTRIQALEKKKREARNRIDEVEDEIEFKRNQLIRELERKLVQKVEVKRLFILRWTLQ
jgi:SNF2 family DNA or RNA helicase